MTVNIGEKCDEYERAAVSALLSAVIYIPTHGWLTPPPQSVQTVKVDATTKGWHCVVLFTVI